MRPDQTLDEDSVTKFKMTFSGIEGRYATILEQGPLEQTTYFYDLKTGIFTGFRGRRSYGPGTPLTRTETWLREQR